MRLRALAVVALAVSWPTLAQRPSFEVASVKPATGALDSPFGPPPNPEHFTSRAASLRWLIQTAYGLDDYQVSGPSVLDSRFDVQATAASGTPKGQMNLMLQSLLQDRFHLTFHYVTKEMSVYNMVVGKNGLKLRESIPTGPCAGSGRRPPGAPPCPPESDQFGIARSKADGPAGMGSPGASVGHIAFGRNVDMKILASVVHFQIGSPVLDKTGVAGTFDIRMSFASSAAPDDTPYPDIISALDQQLGLKLEPTKASVQVMMVDHADSVPVAN